MALKATVYKFDLQISDMDRHYYASHALTLALHPSETEERLMVRLLAFALYADEALQFGRGLSCEDEPDLWRKDLTGVIEQWIDVGQPEESRLRRACGRAGSVVAISYSGRSAALWWEKNGAGLARLSNLEVLDLDPDQSQALARLAGRNARLQCLIQDGQMQWLDEAGASVLVEPRRRQAPMRQRP